MTDQELMLQAVGNAQHIIEESRTEATRQCAPVKQVG
jgi:hypothetical protein